MIRFDLVDELEGSRQTGSERFFHPINWNNESPRRSPRKISVMRCASPPSVGSICIACRTPPRPPAPWPASRAAIASSGNDGDGVRNAPAGMAPLKLQPINALRGLLHYFSELLPPSHTLL